VQTFNTLSLQIFKRQE